MILFTTIILNFAQSMVALSKSLAGIGKVIHSRFILGQNSDQHLLDLSSLSEYEITRARVLADLEAEMPTGDPDSLRAQEICRALDTPRVDLELVSRLSAERHGMVAQQLGGPGSYVQLLGPGLGNDIRAQMGRSSALQAKSQFDQNLLANQQYPVTMVQLQNGKVVPQLITPSPLIDILGGILGDKKTH